MARGISRQRPNFLMVVIEVCVCTCWLVVLIEEGRDLGRWGSFAMDENLYDLSNYESPSDEPVEPLESPAQYLLCKVSL